MLQSDNLAACIVMSNRTIQHIHISQALSRAQGVGVHLLVTIMHVDAQRAFQYNKDAAATLVACLKQRLIGLN